MLLQLGLYISTFGNNTHLPDNSLTIQCETFMRTNHADDTAYIIKQNRFFRQQHVLHSSVSAQLFTSYYITSILVLQNVKKTLHQARSFVRWEEYTSVCSVKFRGNKIVIMYVNHENYPQNFLNAERGRGKICKYLTGLEISKDSNTNISPLYKK